jgi:TPR repeat protein
MKFPTFTIRYVVAVACSLMLSCLGTMPSHADKRVALVIGNGAYAHAPRLPNPVHDAEDVATALKRMGFETIVGTDLNQAGMQDIAIRFARAARTADVALFYYSGHAMQFAGVNYLEPIDADLRDEADLRRMARVDEVLADLQQAKNLRILVLDSCRDNPLADELRRSLGSTRGASLGRGLARMESPDGTIVSYSTQSGRTAEDGTGRNSSYTTAFLRHIEDKDDISTVFHHIGANVYETSKGAQLPELSLSFFGEFYLNGKMQINVASVAPVDPCSAAADHWKSAEAIGTIAAFEDHLARFPNCAFVGLAKARIESLKQAATAGPTAGAVPPRSTPSASPINSSDLEAARIYKLATDRGDASAQVRLGSMYETGRGVPRDDTEAARLYKLAADQGNASAQNSLAFMYLEGRGGLPKDDGEAARLYRLSADQGQAGGQSSLGYMYLQGRGVPRNDAKAARLFKLSADQGHPNALHFLGFLYLTGRGGLPKDDREAARLFKLAADQYKLAADQGMAWAEYALGNYYRDGLGGLPKDNREAARLYERAADQGYLQAQFNLAKLYEAGRGGVAKAERKGALSATRRIKP